MPTPIESIIAAGSKVWLDSVDPDLVAANRKLGATGATSNPIIISDLIRTGRYDDRLGELLDIGLDDQQIAWKLTDEIVEAAQEVFLPVWKETQGEDGYVSFELDPLLEDPRLGPPHDDRVMRYIELGQKYSAGHRNRMIKVPATEAGLAALGPLASAGVTLNVTLIFTPRQYEIARQNIWEGVSRGGRVDKFKSVYSIFISRLDVYTAKHETVLSEVAQGMVGLVNVKRIWAENERFWKSVRVPRSGEQIRLHQEIVFASTGTKLKSDPPDKYVAALVGSGIQTNPPATNDAVQAGGKTYERTVDQMPPPEVLNEIDRKVDMEKLERTLMAEGVAKFADPFKELLALIGQKREALAGAK